MNYSAPELFLQLAFLWAGQQIPLLLQGLMCLWQGTLSLWLIPLPGGKWALHLPVQTPTASLLLVLPIPVHLAQKLQAVPNRRLKALTLQVGRELVKRLEWWTRIPGDENWDAFRNVSESHGGPCSGFPMHVLAEGRIPCTWRVGTHGMGTMQYDQKVCICSLYLINSIIPKYPSLCFTQLCV